jgi:hypothetical protein
MGGYLPHLNNSLVDLRCTLFYPAGIPHWTQRSADTSPTSIIHLWIYAAHCSIPLVYRTELKRGRMHCRRSSCWRETGLVLWRALTAAWCGGNPLQLGGAGQWHPWRPLPTFYQSARRGSSGKNRYVGVSPHTSYIYYSNDFNLYRIWVMWGLGWYECISWEISFIPEN